MTCLRCGASLVGIERTDANHDPRFEIPPTKERSRCPGCGLILPIVNAWKPGDRGL